MWEEYTVPKDAGLSALQETRPAVRRRIGIIGAGPGGMAAAYRLKQAGYADIVIWERTEDFGGTWNVNRYPGLECDVPSLLYSFSFDLNPAWSKSFARQPEILEYMKGAADRMGIRPYARFSTEVTRAIWDDECNCWRVGLSNGEEDAVDVLISAQGMFNQIKWPEIDGLETFDGILFHTARWREDVDLTGRRVAVIGSAATAVQMLPVIAEQVGHVDLYQRTPNWVLPKDDKVFDAETLAAREADIGLVREERLGLFRDFEKFINWPEIHDDSEFIELGRQNLLAVEDPEVRARLTPDFNWGCARPLSSNEYYPTFNRDNVDLITERAARITSQGIVDATGAERQYDVIICATGYHVDRFLSALDVRGRGGVRIRDAWADGAHAYLGITTHGFPNLFMSYGPNTNQGSLITMAELEAAYMVRHIEWMDTNDIAWIDVKPETEKQYNEELQSHIGKVTLWKGSCHNYYFSETGRIVTQYPLNMSAYREHLMRPDWDNFAFEQGVSTR